MRNPITYIAAKAALAPRLIALLPPHRVYVEPFGGAAHVLFQKPRSPIEVYNDTDDRLANLFQVLRDHYDDLAARLRWTLYARSAHAAWRRISGVPDPIEQALQTFYLLQSSMAGDITSSWAYSRLRPHAQHYELSKDLLAGIAGRFRGVAIENRDFRQVIAAWDSAETAFFCDPPYYGRAGSQFWRFSQQDHADLASLLGSIKGKALVTYYDHPEIRSLYQDWTIIEHERPRRGSNLFGRPASRVCELIILNYDPPEPASKGVTKTTSRQ